MRRLAARLEFDCPFEKRDSFRITFGFQARPADRDERLSEIGPQSQRALEAADAGVALSLGDQSLANLVFGRRIAGVQRQFRLKLAARVLQRLRSLRIDQNHAGKPEMQVERAWILFDRLSIFRRSLLVFALNLENLA